ncbi:TIGR00366 family protein [Vicingaceae bacterium]|nr:TIGR00366 family protein [Vicingaceae bacterium]
MSFSEKYSRLFSYLLPTPFTIALVLTIVTFFLGIVFLYQANVSIIDQSITVFSYFEKGVWNNGLMVFALQMMLILVLGHALALSKPFDQFIQFFVKFCTTTSKSAAIVAFLTILVAYFNWGLALIFGAIFARKVGEAAQKNGIAINYPLIGAAGYVGLMVWHGGISGSSLTKVAESGHLKSLMVDLMPTSAIDLLPNSITFSETVFSSMNITASIAVLIAVPFGLYLVGKKVKEEKVTHLFIPKETGKDNPTEGAERMDHSKWFGRLIGSLFILYSIYQGIKSYPDSGLGFINLNYINFFLFGLCLAFHESIREFLSAIDEGIGGAAGILIQFPVYFGIMGIMNSSGLIQSFSDFFVSISSETTFPIFSLISAGIVNLFVPSGGGQWAVQGPIIVQAAQEIGVSLPKSILALAYGDQLTNMLQPFWALPLLAVTKLKAQQILPYTLFLFLIGSVIYVSVLLIF